MRIVVGVTDGSWASFLREREGLTEANFWVPAGGTFRSLDPGEPFLFKTKAPHNQLIGGGFYDRFFELRVSEAWAVFGEGNGLASEDELHRKIQGYRARTGKPFMEDPTIGCVILRNLFFAPPGEELPQPAGWGRSIVRWKVYGDPADPDTAYVRHAFQVLGSEPRVDLEGWDADLRGVRLELDERRFGEPVLTRPRLGQGAFKLSLVDAYRGRCAVTSSKITPTLEAAHIKPYAQGGRHDITNGLLLRSDVHKLYDDGYVGVDPSYRIRVSPRLERDFGNGKEFYRLERIGMLIALPDRRHDAPEPAALEWHMDTVFKSA